MADRSRPALTELAASLPLTVPFVGPEAMTRARGRSFAARIGANESGFGPAPSVIAAMREAAPDMWMYGDPENHELKAALARHLDIGFGNVSVGEGIDGLLGLSVRLYAGEGRSVVTSQGAYPTFNFHVAGFGARLVTVPYRDDREDLNGLLEAVRRENATLVYLSNPDNPMGSWWEADEIDRFVAAVPETTMVLLDEAYGETAPASAIPAIDVSRPNLLRFRTFSKAYGLAGLRCGYVFGEAEAIADFDKVRNHYGMTRMAQAAGLAALADQAYLGEVVKRVAAARDRIATTAHANGLMPLPSATNFVTVDCGRDGAFAKRVLDALLDADIFVRKPMAPGLDRCIRITAGPDADIGLLEAALPAALSRCR
jgi:histidinol-phosphate aminotransferase